MRRPILCFAALFLPVTVLCAGEAGPIAAADFFKGGTVETWKGRRITIKYDLAKPECLADFDPVNPFLVPPAGGFEVRDGALKGRGVGALCHKGVFEADVDVKLTLFAPEPKDIGVALLKPGMTDQFLIFALADTFYLGLDRQPINSHMITMVGAEDAGEAGSTQFRYLARSAKPALTAGAPVEVEVLKRGARNRLVIAGTSLDGADKYGQFAEVQPALYVLKSEMTVTALSISGKLSEAWLKKAGIVYDPNETDDDAVKEIEPPKGDLAPVDPPPQDNPRPRPPLLGGSASETGQAITRFSDKALAEKDRKDAAAGIAKDDVKVEEFRMLLNCLYSEDLLTRTLAIETLKRITGKAMGYDPRAPADKRKDAIREWFKWFMQNRDRLK